MNIQHPLIATTTQRQVGYVIVAIVLAAMVIYWLFNWLEGRKEAGAEIELAANRKPAPPDDILETKRLDLALTGGLVTLTAIALALPLYWLGEPGRQQGLVEFTDDQYVKQGEEIYAANCAQCHGSANGDGGFAADYSLVDGNGVYVGQVQWRAPSLAAVLDRFSYDEVKYILNYGRSNSPMPAWGGAGGGAMTDQHLDKVIAYLAHEQKSSEEIAAGVTDGLALAALQKARADNPKIYHEWLKIVDEIDHLDDSEDGDAVADQISRLTQERNGLSDDLKEIADGLVERSASDQLLYGELLFNNPAAGGAYGCARCHSAGWSYDANAYPDNELLGSVVDGSGGFGPSLASLEKQFSTAQEQVKFVKAGSENGQAYGTFGQGDGGGQMPGFGGCSAEDNPLDFPRIAGERIAGHCEGRTGILTEEQIAAIVAYERSLN